VTCFVQSSRAVELVLATQRTSRMRTVMYQRNNALLLFSTSSANDCTNLHLCPSHNSSPEQP
jgi:hypothetical protein